MPDHDDAWYTENIQRLPTDLLWKMSRQQGLFWGPQVFLFLLARRALGWKLRPAFGVRRPTALARISERSVPHDVLEGFVPARRACQAAGFRPCFLTQPACIGGRTVHAGTFLHESGLAAAIVGLIRTTIKRRTFELLTFACESEVSDGTKLVTQLIEPLYLRHNLIVPGVEVLAVPPHSDPSDIVAAHMRRIENRRDLIRFDPETLADAVLAERQRYFDWRVEQELLVPISARDVRRLRGS